MHTKKIISEIIIGFLIISSFVIFIEKTEAIAGEYFVDDDFYIIRDGSAEHPFETIQDAIDEANNGDTIYVFGGTYNEAFTIDKKLTIMGSIEEGNSTITYTTDHKYTIIISADNVNFTGFDIHDETDNIISQLKGALIHVTSDNVIIQNNNFKNCEKGWGIHLDGSDNNIIRNNIFYNVKSGVYFSNSDTSDLVNNSIENCIDAAIYLKNSKNNRIYDSFLRSSSYGLYATDSNNINITNNTIIGNDLHGIGLFLGNNDIIRMNKVVQNNGNGIHLDSANSEISDNKVVENLIGIKLDNSKSHIFDNFINGSVSTGIFASFSSSSNYIYLNYLNENGINAKDNGNNNWDYNGQGNYWDDYNNIDFDFNGIGDRPYAISGAIQDNYPLGVFLQPPIKPFDPSPTDAQENVGLKVTLSVEVRDPEDDSMDVYFYNAVDDSLLGVDSSVPHGDRAGISFNLDHHVTFAWYAIAKDNKLQNQSDIWYFVTRRRPAENIAPVADTGGPYISDEDTAVDFDASGSYDPDGKIEFYRWNFGDDTTEILDELPSHKYNNPGEFIATLTVIDDNGTSAMETVSVTIEPSKNDPPQANVNGPYNSYTGQIVSFSSIGSSDPDPGDSIVSYFWDFGDGTNSTEPNPTHNYSTANNYPITLTVTDSGGLTDNATTYIIVSAIATDQSPGFELLIAIIAIGLTFILYLRRKNKNFNA